ncbi:MAG: cupin domain-containing protein [Sedimentisphaerales bacterium]|nr:cupin domain-containing protein [Sedimentisphaerales bacterium]
MKPLPLEGGWFVETYRAKENLSQSILGKRYVGARNLATAILYLLKVDTVSLLHRLKSDEIFHFYLGAPVTMLQLQPNGKSEIITLGRDILSGQKPQVVIPQGVWQGAFVRPGGNFALLGCTVAPGYDDDDFEIGDRADLLRRYPDRKKLILKLTRG